MEVASGQHGLASQLCHEWLLALLANFPTVVRTQPPTSKWGIKSYYHTQKVAVTAELRAKDTAQGVTLALPQRSLLARQTGGGQGGRVLPWPVKRSCFFNSPGLALPCLLAGSSESCATFGARGNRGSSGLPFHLIPVQIPFWK